LEEKKRGNREGMSGLGEGYPLKKKLGKLLKKKNRKEKAVGKENPARERKRGRRVVGPPVLWTGHPPRGLGGEEVRMVRIGKKKKKKNI